MGAVRIRSSEARDASAASPRRRVAGILLSPLFGALLLVPILRRERRKARWRWVRIAGWLAGVAFLVAGWDHAWAQAAGAALFLAATILRGIEDPERLRKAAERLGARHVVNGGFFVAGDPELKNGLKKGTTLLFFISPAELLAASASAPEQVIWRCPLAGIEAIQVATEDYQPHYVSFAKAPPVRDDNADRDARCCLTLQVSEADGIQARPHKLDFEYRGVFARHLAEIAAHTIYSCRALARQKPAERLPVIG